MGVTGNRRPTLPGRCLNQSALSPLLGRTASGLARPVEASGRERAAARDDSAPEIALQRQSRLLRRRQPPLSHTEAMTTRLLVDAWAAQAGTHASRSAAANSPTMPTTTPAAPLIDLNEVTPHLLRFSGCRRVVTVDDPCGMPLVCVIRRVGNFSRKIPDQEPCSTFTFQDRLRYGFSLQLSKSTPAHNPSAEVAEAGE